MKKVRTIRIDKEVSDNLDSICNRHGDVSWHIEQALISYGPILILCGKPDKPAKPKLKTKQFIPPTLWETIDYFQEKGSTIEESHKFIDFYESKGWMVGKNKMKDWKASVRNWLRGKSNERNQKPIKQSVTERATEQTRAVWAECEAEEVREHVLPENDTLL